LKETKPKPNLALWLGLERARAAVWILQGRMRRGFFFPFSFFHSSKHQNGKRKKGRKNGKEFDIKVALEGNQCLYVFTVFVFL
jgi:hypothetical protein